MRRRLVLLSTAITAMVVIAFVLPLGLLVRDLAADRATTPAQLRAQALAPVVGFADTFTLQAAVQATQQSVSGEVHVRAPDGTVLGVDAFPDVPLDRAGVFALSGGGRVAVVPVTAAAGTGVVAITIPAGDLRTGVLGAWAMLGALGMLLIAGAAWLTDRLARSTTEAMEDVESTARRLSQGDLGARTLVDDPPEVARVADALNELAARTRELLDEERERAADLSHALRTPLTALRLDLESLPSGEARDSVAQDVEAMRIAIDRAIQEARRPVREGSGRRCDLAEVTRDRLAWWDPLAQDEGRSAAGSFVPEHPCWVRASRQDISEMVDALIGNVLSHTESGTPFRVTLSGDEGDWVLAVTDEGPGLPDLDVLARGVSGAGSTGLGLAIVLATASAAGGGAEVSGRRDGIVVRLPQVSGPR